MSIKQVIVMRTDLNMRKGKMCAQASHASMMFLTRGSEIRLTTDSTSELEGFRNGFLGFTISQMEDIKTWTEGLFTKVCLQCNSEKDLVEIYQHAQKEGLIVNLVTDAGLTEFNGVPTKTCIAIGPAKTENVDKVTGHLRLL
jgi:PTH2 family peptidyl-tRNA hydrolase